MKHVPESHEPSHAMKELDMESMEEAAFVVAVVKQLCGLGWLPVLLADFELAFQLTW